MQLITSFLPSSVQTSLNSLSYISKELYMLGPLYFSCRVFIPSAAAPTLVFTVSLLCAKLVRKHLHSYSNVGLGTLKKYAWHLSKRLFIVQVIAAIATFILFQIVASKMLLMVVSGAFFGLCRAEKDLAIEDVTNPNYEWFNHKDD